jgi:hypothetical protein
LLFKILNSSLFLCEFVVLIINVLTKVIKFIVKKLNLGVFVLDLGEHIYIFFNNFNIMFSKLISLLNRVVLLFFCL